MGPAKSLWPFSAYGHSVVVLISSVQFQFHSQDPSPKSQTGDFRFLFLLAFLKTRAFGLEPKPVPAPKKFPSPRMTKGEQFCSQQLQLISVPFISMKLICCSSCLATFNRCSTPNRIVPLTSAEKYFCGSKQFLIHEFRKKNARNSFDQMKVFK